MCFLMSCDWRLNSKSDKINGVVCEKIIVGLLFWVEFKNIW